RVVRRGSREDERRARSGPLGGPTLEGPSPPCTYDDDRLRLPPASTPRSSKAGKKESTGHRLNRPCQPCATLSSNSSLGYHRSDARTAENGFATSSGVSKSAKVVLVPTSVAPMRALSNNWRHEGVDNERAGCRGEAGLGLRQILLVMLLWVEFRLKATAVTAATNAPRRREEGGAIFAMKRREFI